MTSAADYREIPIDKIELDPDHPRRDSALSGEDDPLLKSIREFGIMVPLSVIENFPDHYFIIDGQRRYRCAKRISLSTVPCCVHSNLDKGEGEILRYELQENHKPWTAAERTKEIKRMKKAQENPK